VIPEVTLNEESNGDLEFDLANDLQIKVIWMST